MYNRYVSSEHSYEPSEISEPSAAESEPYISKEKYIRENDTVQEGNTHSSAFFVILAIYKQKNGKNWAVF